MKLTQAILQLLGRPSYLPMDKVGISKALGLSADQRRKLRQTLEGLEMEGRIVRIRKTCFALPATADLLTGKVLVFPNGNAKLVVENGKTAEIRIPASDLWVAMHQDRVVARLKKGGIRRAGAVPREPECEVIRILKRANETVVGTLFHTKGRYHVTPDNPRLLHNIYPRDFDKVRGKKPVAGEKVVVRLDPWESPHEAPEGVIIEVLGEARSPKVELMAIFRKHDLPEEFPAGVLKEAEGFAETLRTGDLRGREDLRGQPVITIDPDDAKDFDDAIHVERCGDGWSLSVHIADVSHYVKPDSHLDREARKRGNSTYLAELVVPMLPERLSNGLCSLKPGVDRLAFSAFLEFNAQGKLRRARFARTVIRSIARLTYRQAYAILEGKMEGRTDLPQPPPGSLPFSNREVVERVKAAWELARILRRNRFSAGSLDLDFPEVKVWLDKEGRPERLERIENDWSHQLVEECMLAANEAVAAHLKRNGRASVYRVHESPDPERLRDFREKAIAHGYKVGDLTVRREVLKLLGAIKGTPEEYLVKLDLLKSLKRATYDVRPLGHYGLSKVNYTHFTSPIRRYADLLVHRALAGEKMLKPEPLREAAQHISETERKSADAEKDSKQLKKAEFFEKQLGRRHPEKFRAVVIDVRGHGLIVELPDVLMTGLIHVSALAGDFYVFDEARLCFRGRKTKRRYGLGSVLEVVVSRVDLYRRQVDFAPCGD